MDLFAKTHYQVQEEKKVREILSFLKNKKILDLGCGTGKYLRILKSLNIEAVGIDANLEQVNALRKEGLSAFSPEQIESELKDAKFDVILMIHIIEHMAPKQLTQFLDTYLPMLNDDGQLIIITPTLSANFYYDPTHIRPYYPQSLWMLMGTLSTPAEFKAKEIMELKDIYFFKDSWRLREHRHYYPIPDYTKINFYSSLLHYTNLFLAFLHSISGARLGKTASWLGIYKKVRPEK